MASSAVEAAAVVGASRSRYSVAHLFLSSRSFLPDGLLNRQSRSGTSFLLISRVSSSPNVLLFPLDLCLVPFFPVLASSIILSSLVPYRSPGQYQLGAIYRSAFGASLATQIEFFSRKVRYPRDLLCLNLDL